MLTDTERNLESLHTRMRLQAAQFAYWGKQGIALWLGCLIGVLLYTFTPLQMQRVMIWVMSSGLSQTRWKSIRWHGEKYDPHVLRDWLNATTYHAPLSEWLIWAGWIALIPVTVIGGIWWWHVSRKQPKEIHLRGAEILSPAVLQKRLKKAGPAGVQIGSVWIPRELERLHMSLCGGTGSGKSVTLRTLLRQIALRGEPCIVVDSKGAFVREFYSPARGDWLLNATDFRCPWWTPWVECDGPVDMMAQAASLFPVLPGMHATSAYYNGEAAKAFHSLLEHHTGRDPREIPGLLDSFLKKGLANRAGILQTLERGCQSFRYLAPGSRTWSAKEWIRKVDGTPGEGASWCFLTFRETEKAALLPIVSLWLESLTRQILTRQLNPAQTIWVIVDELASLQAQPTLMELMAKGREYGAACVIGFQTILQLYGLYGENEAEAMLSHATTKLYLSTQNSKTQEWCARNIGEQEVLRKTESAMVGLDNRDTFQQHTQQRVEATVLASQLGALPPLQGYFTVGYYGTTIVDIEEAYMVEREPGFVPRAEALVTAGVATAPALRVVSTERRAL